MNHWAVAQRDIGSEWPWLDGTPVEQLNDQQRKWALETVQEGDWLILIDWQMRWVVGLDCVYDVDTEQLGGDRREVRLRTAGPVSFDVDPTFDQLEECGLFEDMSDADKCLIWPVSKTAFDSIVKRLPDLEAIDRSELQEWFDGVPDRLAEWRQDDAEQQDNAVAESIERGIKAIEAKLAENPETYKKQKVDAMIRNDRALIRALKQKYGYRCQWPGCDAYIPMPDGTSYCEVAHIQAVSEGGAASSVNLLVLCPNHHKTLDLGDVAVIRNTRHQLSLQVNGERVEIPR